VSIAMIAVNIANGIKKHNPTLTANEFWIILYEYECIRKN